MTIFLVAVFSFLLGFPRFVHGASTPTFIVSTTTIRDEHPYYIEVDGKNAMTIYTKNRSQCIDLYDIDASVLILSGNRMLSARKLCVEPLKENPKP